jgi:hypothetical protein
MQIQDMVNKVADPNLIEWWVPIEKAEETPEGDRILRGLASTDDEDLQGESVIQRGLNISYLKSRGFINWDHGKGASAIIGEPISADVTQKGLYIEGRLYKGKNAPEAEAAWNLAKTLDGNKSSRRLGWSIQGRVKERAGTKITKADVFHVALTAQPVNPKTFAEIAKSFGEGDGVDVSEVGITTGVETGFSMIQLLKSETHGADGSITKEYHPIAIMQKALVAGGSADSPGAVASGLGGRTPLVSEDLEKDKPKKSTTLQTSKTALKKTTYEKGLTKEDAYALIRKAFPTATDIQCDRIIELSLHL